MGFFDESVILRSDQSKRLYAACRDLPIIDIHSHLDPRAIAENDRISDVGELWLAHDHYKWRAMRLCGVDERFITGDASYEEKFMAYARILPSLAGNPLYYFTHFELNQIFGINDALNEKTAAQIYVECSAKLSEMRVSDLLKKYRVSLAATTDDPAHDLRFHGLHGKTALVPTFRPDRYFCPTDDDLARLSAASGVNVETLGDMLEALARRLDFFVSKGCFMSDHGFERFPDEYVSEREAAELFKRRESLSDSEKNALFGFILCALMREYRKRGVIAQLHFAVRRNVNRGMFGVCGADSGFDVIGDAPSVVAVERFLSRFGDAERPQIILYTLNDASLRALAALTGAFRGVRIGAAWWFNDTREGILRTLETVAEYSALGTSLGMLTDSRSFAGYSRFDFFRRILCDYVGRLVRRGEYEASGAKKLVYDVCFGNAYEAACKNEITKNMIVRESAI